MPGIAKAIHLRLGAARGTGQGLGEGRPQGRGEFGQEDLHGDEALLEHFPELGGGVSHALGGDLEGAGDALAELAAQFFGRDGALRNDLG